MLEADELESPMKNQILNNLHFLEKYLLLIVTLGAVGGIQAQTRSAAPNRYGLPN